MEYTNKIFWGMPVKTYCLMLHLSQLASIVLPGLGLALPIIMWLVNKDKDEQIDHHGRAAINWIISLAIYCVVIVAASFAFMFFADEVRLFFVGFLGFVILAVLNFIFAISAAIKANEGVARRYPLSIQFLK